MLASQCVPLFLRRLPGHPAQAVREEFKLPADAATAFEVSVPLSTLWAFSEACATAAKDPLLGVHVAFENPRGTYGLIEFAARNAPTLEDAFRRLVTFGTLVNELVSFELEPVKRPAGLVVRHSVPGEPLAVGRQCNEYWAALMVHLGRQLIGPGFAPAKVWLAHPEHAEARQVREALGCPVQFGMGSNGLSLTKECLATPIALADLALLKVLDDQALRATAQRPARADLLGRVRTLIRELLPSAGSIIERIAARLHMSARTLQRRLDDEGVRFHDLVEHTRQTLAMELIDDRSRDLGQIAFELGYSDVRAFARAFRRWTQLAPSDYRRSAQ